MVASHKPVLWLLEWGHWIMRASDPQYGNTTSVGIRWLLMGQWIASAHSAACIALSQVMALGSSGRDSPKIAYDWLRKHLILTIWQSYLSCSGHKTPSCKNLCMTGQFWPWIQSCQWSCPVCGSEALGVLWGSSGWGDRAVLRSAAVPSSWHPSVMKLPLWTQFHVSLGPRILSDSCASGEQTKEWPPDVKG
jgi:hypothetical protein